MIVLDTNIISEMMKPAPMQTVVAWLNQQEKKHLFITTITIAEIAYGLHILPEGKRRQALLDSFHQVVIKLFKFRTLTFDEQTAYVYGEIMARRKSHGKPLSVPDGQIAAIAYRHHAMLATRNIRDFNHCDLKLIDPFLTPAQ